MITAQPRINKPPAVSSFRPTFQRVPEHMEETASGEPHVVLLVEDNQAHAQIIQLSFEQCFEGHSIALYHVDDGDAALQFLFHKGAYADPVGSPRPHLILLDLRLPKVSGLEVLEEIKSTAALREIPVIVLTTSAAKADIEWAYAWQADGYIVKPSSFDGFMDLVEELRQTWLPN